MSAQTAAKKLAEFTEGVMRITSGVKPLRGIAACGIAACAASN